MRYVTHNPPYADPHSRIPFVVFASHSRLTVMWFEHLVRKRFRKMMTTETEPPIGGALGNMGECGADMHVRVRACVRTRDTFTCACAGTMCVPCDLSSGHLIL